MVGRWHILLKWFPFHGTCSCSEGVNTARVLVYLNRCNIFLSRNKDKFNHLMIKSWPTFFHLCSGLPENFAELRCLYVKKHHHAIILTVPCHHFGMSSLPWSPETFKDIAGCCGLLCQQFPCHAAFRWRGHGRRGEHRGQGCDAGGGGVSSQRTGTTTRWAGLLGGWVGKKPGLPANSTN